MDIESPGCEPKNFGDTARVRESELMIDFSPGYRVYIAIDLDTVDVLLCGGDRTAVSEPFAARE